jgi:hypothetical protein
MVFVRRSSRVRRIVASFVLVTFTSLAVRDLFVPATAWAASPREELTKAEDYFQVADFATALQKVDALLKSGDLEGSALRDAYVLKARCELGLAHRSSATDAFCQALRVDGAWRPDPDFFTKDEVDTFEQARTNCTGVGSGTPRDDAQPKPIVRDKATQDDRGAAAVGESKPWYKKPLILGILGAVVVGGVIFALSGGGDDEGDPVLADFPPPPQ